LEDGKLGKTYQDGETIVAQGEVGDRMFVIQSGRVRVSHTNDRRSVILAELKEGDFFGEMALIDREVRSATVQAIGEVRLLSIDKKNFLRRVHEDPSLAYQILERMTKKIRSLTEEVARLQAR
jgi:CRP-like cAMP-binding protein